MMLMTEMTREEFDARHNDLVARVSRLEGKVDVMSTQLAAANAATSTSGWKFIASLLGGLLVGLLPYIIHLTGALK